jgi:hypothetical protein
MHDEIADVLAQVREQEGSPITYFAGDVEVSLAKVLLGPARQVYHGNTFVETREIMVSAAELTDQHGNQIEPQVGHRLTEDNGSKVHEYEVAILDEEKPAWRWSDPHTRTQRRIFTTFVKAT